MPERLSCDPSGAKVIIRFSGMPSEWSAESRMRFMFMLANISLQSETRARLENQLPCRHGTPEWREIKVEKNRVVPET